jgi:hypothetical protein
MTAPESQMLQQIVDYVFPVLPPYETSTYLYLLRRSHLADAPSNSVRVGKRTIGEGLGKGTRSSRGGSYQHITDKLNNLAIMGFITIGDTNRSGTLYTVSLPMEVPSVREQLASEAPTLKDYYSDAALRSQLFERDGWSCRYCGEHLDAATATLDHVIPVSRGGTNDAENLATSCMMCNSIKSGRTLDEVASLILASVQRRRTRPTSVEQHPDPTEAT